MATKVKPRFKIYEGIVEVCAHRVSFFYQLPVEVELSDDVKTNLTEEAESRVKACIIEGYVQGELNYESEQLSCTGWWKIEN